jgi:hypothetical protein
MLNTQLLQFLKETETEKDGDDKLQDISGIPSTSEIIVTHQE